MSKWYGSVDNRIEEGRNYTGREIREGDDVTMYLWSDRHCYYVTEVVNQKYIKVKPYYVCADKSKPGGMGHQDWMYFKTLREYDEYLNHEPRSDEDYAELDREETWVFRYNKWQSQHYHFGAPHPQALSERERKSLDKNGYYITYLDLIGKVSFGVRDYYYDWEF